MASLKSMLQFQMVPYIDLSRPRFAFPFPCRRLIHHPDECHSGLVLCEKIGKIIGIPHPAQTQVTSVAINR